MAKKDFWLSILAGEIVALLSIPTLKNLTVFDILSRQGVPTASFIAFWVFFIPISAVLGLGTFYLIARYKERLGFFQLGKYAVIGLLNTFLNAGIFNFLIFVTDIARGFIIDLFFAIAFVITVINSFIWNKYWSFEERESENIKEEAVKFFGVSLFVAIINAALVHFIINIVGAPYGIGPKIWANVALVFTIIVAFFGNFFGYKYIVFKK